MDEKRLTEIESLANAATSGPWKYDERPCFEDEVRICGCAVPFPYPRDAKFCAHSRTDIPDLIAAVRERDAEIERLRAALGVIADTDADDGTQWFHNVAQEALM